MPSISIVISSRVLSKMSRKQWWVHFKTSFSQFDSGQEKSRWILQGHAPHRLKSKLVSPLLCKKGFSVKRFSPFKKLSTSSPNSYCATHTVSNELTWESMQTLAPHTNLELLESLVHQTLCRVRPHQQPMLCSALHYRFKRISSCYWLCFGCDWTANHCHGGEHSFPDFPHDQPLVNMKWMKVLLTMRVPGVWNTYFHFYKTVSLKSAGKK